MAQLTIGMPVYNGERYIADALRSLISQDFRDWEMLIADNCSTDRTAEIASEFCREDSRIRLVQHTRNLGAIPNFRFLAERATSPYFMWAAADDEWSANYVGSCMAALKSDTALGFASGSVVNIDLQGAQIRSYKPFSGLDQQKVTNRLANYLNAREVDGKANIIYSVYQTPLLKTLCGIPGIFEGWGADMAFVAAALCRARYMQVTDAVLLKRLVSYEEVEYSRNLDAGRYEMAQFEGHYPPELYRAYLAALCRGMPTFALRTLVFWTMTKRRFRLWFRRKSCCKQNG